MVRLFGAVHGMHITDVLSRESRTRVVALEPTLDLETRLRALPKNTRVGIEHLSPEDRQRIRDHGRTLYAEHRLEGTQLSTRYWERVAEICDSAGHIVVWLEDKNDWLAYNHALIEVGKARREYTYLCKDGEHDRDYFRDLVTLNEKLYRAQVALDKINLLDRDETMLKNMASCDVVVAGIGHAAAWMLNQEDIRNKHGIQFGSFSTDDIVDDQRCILRYTEDAIPDPNLAYAFVSTRKAVHLLENGRLTDDIPDWVGTWDVHEPSRGYFELFVEQQNDGAVNGRIEDCLGTARFEGVISPRFVRFVKTYGDSTSDAIKSAMTYQTEDVGHDREKHQGIFSSARKSDVFYVEKNKGNSPLQLSFSWYDLIQADESR